MGMDLFPGPYSLSTYRLMGVASGAAELFILVVSAPTLRSLLDEVGTVATLGVFLPIWVGLPATALVALIASFFSRADERRRDQERVPLRTTDRVGISLAQFVCGWYLAMLALVAVAAVVGAATGRPIPSLMRVVEGQVPLMGQYWPLALLIALLARGRLAMATSALPPLVFILVTALNGPRDAQTWDQSAYYLIFNLVYIAWATWMVRQARALDEDHARRLSREREVAHHRAATEGRRRRDAFVHDHILSVLDMAARGLADGPPLVEAVHGVLDHLDDVSLRRPPAMASQVFGRIVAQASHLRLSLRPDVRTPADRLVPADIASALEGATLEALRNCERHASGSDGAPPLVRLTLVADRDGLSAVVADDGPGFDPDRIPARRLGVRRSVVERVEHAGGRARIDTAPGDGTAVTLTWPPSRVDAARPSEKEAAPAGAPSSPVADRPEEPDERPPRPYVQPPPERLIAAAVIVFQTVLMWQCLPEFTQAWPVAAALASQIAATVLVLRWWPGGWLPVPVEILVAAIAALSPVAVFAQTTPQGMSEWAPWTGATGSVLLFGLLLLRSRWPSTWVGWIVRLAATAAWAGHADGPVRSVAASLSLSQTLTLIAWTFATVWASRIGRRISHEQSWSRRLEAARDLEEETQLAMDGALASVTGRARPVLGTIARESEPGPLPAATRMEARLLEAELRDEIRAPFFTGTPVTARARAARERGVDVVLVDDSGAEPLEPQSRELVLSQATDRLDRASHGRAVIRVFPPGRDAIATILVDGSRLFITPDGASAEPGRSAGSPGEAQDGGDVEGFEDGCPVGNGDPVGG